MRYAAIQTLGYIVEDLDPSVLGQEQMSLIIGSLL
jgi:hypothetical protein